MLSNGKNLSYKTLQNVNTVWHSFHNKPQLMLYQRTQYFSKQFVLHPKGTGNCESLDFLLHTGHSEYAEPNAGLVGAQHGKPEALCFLLCCYCCFLLLWTHSFYIYLVTCLCIIDESSLKSHQTIIGIHQYEWIDEYSSGPEPKEHNPEGSPSSTSTALCCLHPSHLLQPVSLLHGGISHTTRQALVHNGKNNRGYLFRNSPAQCHQTMSVILS